MKMRLLALFAVAVLMCMPVFAQSSDTSSDATKQDSTSQDTTKQDSTQDTSSQDSMKHDDMKQDSASQDSMKHDDTMAKGSGKAPKAKLRRLSGTVGSDGASFVTDKDQKSWTVMNPEVFKGHEGHHVRVRAHVYPDKNSIHVMSVKMAKEKAAKATADTTKQ